MVSRRSVINALMAKRPIRMLADLIPEWLKSPLRRRLSRAASIRTDQFTIAYESKPEDAVVQTIVPRNMGERPLGLNMVGFFSGDFGLGESARRYAAAFIERGLDVSLCNVEPPDLPHSCTNTTLEQYYSESFPHDYTLVCINPDWWDRALSVIPAEAMREKHVAAFWYWELGRLPQSWLPFIDRADSFVVATEFVESAIRNETDKMISVVPLPMTRKAEHVPSRSAFDIGEDEFVFLTTFDFNSFMERKNPLATVRAFRSAFGGKEAVRLIVKTTNGYRNVQKLQALLDATRDDPRIRVVDQMLPMEHVLALRHSTDAYVSLHRSEGFGLGLAESMLQNTLTIATGWSGNMDFMNADNSLIVDFDLVPVEEGQYPDHEGQSWAEARHDSAVAALRFAFENRDATRMLRDRALRDIEAGHAPAISAAKMEKILMETMALGRDLANASKESKQ